MENVNETEAGADDEVEHSDREGQQTYDCPKNLDLFQTTISHWQAKVVVGGGNSCNVLPTYCGCLLLFGWWFQMSSVSTQKIPLCAIQRAEGVRVEREWRERGERGEWSKTKRHMRAGRQHDNDYQGDLQLSNVPECFKLIWARITGISPLRIWSLRNEKCSAQLRPHVHDIQQHLDFQRTKPNNSQSCSLSATADVFTWTLSKADSVTVGAVCGWIRRRRWHKPYWLVSSAVTAEREFSHNCLKLLKQQSLGIDRWWQIPEKQSIDHWSERRHADSSTPLKPEQNKSSISTGIIV